MSTLDDARKLLQDIVAPDLKAISARLDALEKAVKSGFEATEKIADVRHELMILRMDSGFAAMNAKFETLLNTLNMERRMEQMEAIIAAQNRDRLEASKSS